MQIKTSFPKQIREISHTWISMPDGVRLAARIWLPVDAEVIPVPAILEYIPYRKNDESHGSDIERHPYFAGHGYASVRVDIRGSGDSEGVLLDEYLVQEQDDALEILKWLAAQTWCNGKIGMMGISWGGFSSLQVAARNPPELKAIITVCSTVDRYADDVHYMGGCVLACEMLDWASFMLGFGALPPDPQNVGDRWREMWLERMQNTPPYIEAWLAHQRRDSYWKHGSVCEAYSDIHCPVYAVGGWNDAYHNSILHLLAGLSTPRKGLIGPWSHNYPEHGAPGPAIGFLQECLRWWDYWLKDVDTGIMQEPMLRAWMQDTTEPSSCIRERPGRWVAENDWPASSIETKTYFLKTDRLDADAGIENCISIKSPQITGMDAGPWGSYGNPGGFPGDQRADDGRSLVFTSDPLLDRVEILGFPEVVLEFSVDQPIAMVSVRLCDVSPTGSSLLVTRGLLNLTHLDGHETPTALEPGRRYSVNVGLNSIAHSMPAGHRWRLSISPTYWPHAWPSPQEVTLGVHVGKISRLLLPVRISKPEDHHLLPFSPPEISTPLKTEVIRTSQSSQELTWHQKTDLYELIIHKDGGYRRIMENGIVFGFCVEDSFQIKEGAPLSATAGYKTDFKIGRDAWQIQIKTTSTMTCDPERFLVTNSLDAYEEDLRVFSKSWTFDVKRDLL